MLSRKVEEFLRNAESWSDWLIAEKEIFQRHQWQKTSIEQLEVEEERIDQIRDGTKWTPFLCMYDVDADLLDAYETARWKLFEKLDPKGHATNLSHPELFGWKCNRCRMWSKDIRSDTCPFCGRDLVRMALNEF
jgi:hypothetical protein